MEMKPQLFEGDNLLNTVAIACEAHSWCRYSRDHNHFRFWHTVLPLQSGAIIRAAANKHA